MTKSLAEAQMETNDDKMPVNFTGRWGSKHYYKGREWTGETRLLGYKPRLHHTERGIGYFSSREPHPVQKSRTVEKVVEEVKKAKTKKQRKIVNA